MDGATPETITPAGLVMSVLRRLEPEDLAMLALEPVKQSSLKKIRDSHHALARVLAGGITNIDASRITGFDATYISIMKADPAFQELLAFYEEHDAGQQADLRERMMLIALDVSQEIRDRLHNDPDSFSHSEMRQLLTNLADRVGHGPSSTVHSTVDITETLSYAEQKALAEALKELEALSADNGRDRITLQAQPREEGGAQRPAQPVSREAETLQSVPGGGPTPS